jgi:hypothetical protein
VPDRHGFQTQQLMLRQASWGGCGVEAKRAAAEWQGVVGRLCRFPVLLHCSNCFLVRGGVAVGGWLAAASRVCGGAAAVSGGPQQ